ncbi:glycosyltransferase [Sulfitobacter sp. 1A13679]|uniref:glycosyltransferase n=1 Tax=Sulfitobacter sp. 1A13679 TaxID=3368597 RepID=UPI003744FFBF
MVNSEPDVGNASLLINAANLHSGGGVQVAASTFVELSRPNFAQHKLTAFASSEVISNLDSGDLFGGNSFGLQLLNTRGIDLLNRSARKRMKRFDVVFTIFGPLYRWRPPFKSIVGFAQPWIIYPQNELYLDMSMGRRLQNRLKFWIQGQFFRRADILVVELGHVKEGLVRQLGISPERIYVVENCVSSIYRDPQAWESLSFPACECDLRLGFIGRNYSHKNTKIFPEIVRILRVQHGIKAKFFVTFTEDEWQACPSEFHEVCVNVGPLRVKQCPSFYETVDAVVFPSLLECFSATPLEAMAMKKPLFASDRPFNREICSSYANYFDPLCARSAAGTIAAYFESGKPNKKTLEAAQNHALCFSSAKERAEKYVALLRQESAKIHK